MKKLIVIFSFFVSLSLVAQKGVKERLRFQPPESTEKLVISILPNPKDEINKRRKDDVLFSPCDDMPTYVGGEAAMWKFISENLTYPSSEANVQGRVVLRFIITQTGEVDSIRIVRSLMPEFDAECVRILQLMPKWKTATNCMGTTIPYEYTLPFVFRVRE